MFYKKKIIFLIIIQHKKLEIILNLIKILNKYSLITINFHNFHYLS